MILEIAANSVESAIEAQKGGAQRIELCDNLYEGGTTPSYGTIQLARKNLDIKLHVIIRPRGSDFVYNELEFQTMKIDIEICKNSGVDGVVIGILNPNGTINIAQTKELVELARPMSVTFHRAFDMTKNAETALEDIIKTGADRLLTSGLQNKAYDGKEQIKKLIQQANGRIIVMPGSGIRPENIEEIAITTQAFEFHSTAQSSKESEMLFRKNNVFMHANNIHEFSYKQTDKKIVAQMVEILKKFKK